MEWAKCSVSICWHSQCSKSFTGIDSLNLHCSLFYRWVNWSVESLSNLPITQVGNGKARIGIQAVSIQIDLLLFCILTQGADVSSSELGFATCPAFWMFLSTWVSLCVKRPNPLVRCSGKEDPLIFERWESHLSHVMASDSPTAGFCLF